MQKILVGVLIFFVVSCSSGGQSASSWVQSENPQHQGHSIKHPKGWIVNWSEAGVFVTDPQNPMIWCQVQRYPGSGTSQQFTYSMLNNLHSRFEGLKVVTQTQVHRAPDIFGVKFSYQRDGVLVGSAMLTVTLDGREFVTHCYAAPAQVYDQAKLTLIPILASFRFEGGGSSGKTSGKMQEIRSPQGYWSFLAPPGWKISPNPEEACIAVIEGPEGMVGVRFGSGLFLYSELNKDVPSPLLSMNPMGPKPFGHDYYAESIEASKKEEQLRWIPYLSAEELVRRVLVPSTQKFLPDFKIVDWKPVSPEEVRFSSISTHPQKKIVLQDEITLWNRSLPHPPGYSFVPDFNLFTYYFVSAPPQTLPKVRNLLWQIVNTFKPSANFGAPLIQLIAQMRQQNLQTTTDMVMRNLRTTQKMGRQTVDTTIRMGEQRRQEGEAWLRVFSGTEIAQDPTTGKRYEVPVGGQYIYGNPTTGKVIRSDGPLSANDLPTGFSQLESVGLYP
jgi:hypothetical protein